MLEAMPARSARAARPTRVRRVFIFRGGTDGDVTTTRRQAAATATVALKSWRGAWRGSQSELWRSKIGGVDCRYTINNSTPRSSINLMDHQTDETGTSDSEAVLHYDKVLSTEFATENTVIVRTRAEREVLDTIFVSN